MISLTCWIHPPGDGMAGDTWRDGHSWGSDERTRRERRRENRSFLRHTSHYSCPITLRCCTLGCGAGGKTKNRATSEHEGWWKREKSENAQNSLLSFLSSTQIFVYFALLFKLSLPFCSPSYTREHRYAKQKQNNKKKNKNFLLLFVLFLFLLSIPSTLKIVLSTHVSVICKCVVRIERIKEEISY